MKVKNDYRELDPNNWGEFCGVTEFGEPTYGAVPYLDREIAIVVMKKPISWRGRIEIYDGSFETHLGCLPPGIPMDFCISIAQFWLKEMKKRRR